mgnify:CR=1 FL=1
MEDEGEGVCFHVYVYNVQPGVEIDYATGESWETGDSASSALESQAEEQKTDTFSTPVPRSSTCQIAPLWTV